MRGWRQILVLCLLLGASAGCGGGGSAETGNANPGVYEAAYSRGGGSLVINIPSGGGAINAILVDEAGGTFSGTLTGSPGSGGFHINGTLHDIASPSTTIVVDAVVTLANGVEISGNLTGALSVSFLATRQEPANDLTPAQLLGTWQGTDILMQGHLQVAADNVFISFSSTGILTGTWQSIAIPSTGGSFSARVASGGGFVGTSIANGQSSPVIFFGTITKPSADHLTVKFTNPGSSPGQDTTGTMTLVVPQV